MVMGAADPAPTDRNEVGGAIDSTIEDPAETDTGDTGTPSTSVTPPPGTTPDRLNPAERSTLELVRRFGTVGALLMAAGSLGASAFPVFNPLSTVPLLGVFVRMPTVALASVYAGMAMVVIAWLWLGRFARPGRKRLLSRSQLDRTLVMWMAPLVAIPPMFSRDTYSYLAQSKIAALGLDPYTQGPAHALGLTDPLTLGVDNIWRNTPAPYGPLFLTLGRFANSVTGNHVVTGIYFQRLLELIGIAIIVWALPRLARRLGVEPVSALWLGAANPLLLFHLVAGAHNEALMLGLMLAGLEIAIQSLPKMVPGGPIPRVTAAEIGWQLAGAALITFGAAVKLPAAAALGFLGVMIARRWGARFKHLVYAALFMAAVSGVIMIALCIGTGLGFGWINSLNVNGTVNSWQSPVTAIGYLAGGLGILFGLGNHTVTTIGVMRLLGEVGGAVVMAKFLWDSFRGRLNAMTGLGLGMGAFVLLGGTLLPWYLLWAIVPLAAAIRASRFRTWAALLSVFFSLITPPTGGTFNGHGYVLPESWAAAAVVVVLAVVAVRRRIPIWHARPV